MGAAGIVASEVVDCIGTIDMGCTRAADVGIAAAADVGIPGALFSAEGGAAGIEISVVVGAGGGMATVVPDPSVVVIAGGVTNSAVVDIGGSTIGGVVSVGADSAGGRIVVVSPLGRTDVAADGDDTGRWLATELATDSVVGANAVVSGTGGGGAGVPPPGKALD